MSCERRADGQVVLDERFMPDGAEERARRRADDLPDGTAGPAASTCRSTRGACCRVGTRGRCRDRGLPDAQIINRYEPVVAHLASSPSLHPEELFRLGLEITGELSTLTASSRRPPQFPTYRHDALRATFDPVINALRASLQRGDGAERDSDSARSQEVRHQCGERRRIRRLFDYGCVRARRAGGRAVRRPAPPFPRAGEDRSGREDSRSREPAAARASGCRRWRSRPGRFRITRALRTSSSIAPTSSGARSRASGGIAIHQSGDFPNLAMELWAIRG